MTEEDSGSEREGEKETGRGKETKTMKCTVKAASSPQPQPLRDEEGEPILQETGRESSLQGGETGGGKENEGEGGRE